MKILRMLRIKKWVYLFAVPSILFLACAVFALIYVTTFEVSITTIPVVQPKPYLLRIPQGDITDNKIIKGEFQARENNLGVIGLSIKNTLNTAGYDSFTVYFRIKEKNAPIWYATNTYSGGQFHELELFPFGFPVITNSQNKIYDFEIYTKGAAETNSLSVLNNHLLVSEYQISRSQLKKPAVLISYLMKKIVFCLGIPRGLIAIVIYFLPFIGYFYLLYDKQPSVLPSSFQSLLLVNFINKYMISNIIYILNWLLKKMYQLHVLSKERLVQNIPIINIFLSIAIFLDILFVHQINNISILIVFILWAISIIEFKFTYISSYIFAMFFLIGNFIFLTLGLDSFAEKASIWAYLFFILFLLHLLHVVITKKSDILLDA